MPADIEQKNSDAIHKAIQTLSTNKQGICYDTVSQLLPQMLANGTLNLDASAYTPRDPLHPNGAGRYLVYAYDDDKNQPFSIWAFAFAKKQKTSIHDHKYRGTVSVLEGSIAEKFYRPIQKDNDSVSVYARYNRHKFHSRRDDLQNSRPQAHQLKNSKNLPESTIAVTLHIYEMPAQQFNEEQQTFIDNRNLSTIYHKVKTKNVPPYQEEYAENTNSLPCNS